MKILGQNKCMIILKILEHIAKLIYWKITVYIPLEVNKVLIWPYLQQKLIVVNS